MKLFFLTTFRQIISVSSREFHREAPGLTHISSDIPEFASKEIFLTSLLEMFVATEPTQNSTANIGLAWPPGESPGRVGLTQLGQARLRTKE